MSINSRMKTYEVWENKKVTDEWGAETEEETKVGMAEVSINFFNSANISNDMKYAEVTHTGLTLEKTLKKGQILVLEDKRYVIFDVPNTIARYTQLLLKEVVQ